MGEYIPVALARGSDRRYPSPTLLGFSSQRHLAPNGRKRQIVPGSNAASRYREKCCPEHRFFSLLAIRETHDDRET